jgi:UDPglucose 6-dehydrogenase
VLSIKNGLTPFYEPELDHLLNVGKKSFNVFNDIRKIKNNIDLLFLTVGTPLNKEGRIDLAHLELATEAIKKYFKGKKMPVIIIKSTVVPGTTNRIMKYIQTSMINEKNQNISILSNPEFLREGKAIEDTTKPHLIVIGGNNENSILKLRKFYKELYGNEIPFIITNPQTAEMIKYANNSFLATKISFINQLANICQSINGVNIDEVANAIGIDPRIGSQFLKAGPGYGGSCLPKDIQALISFSEQIGQSPTLLKAVQRINNNQLKIIIKSIKKQIKKTDGAKITILGLSFKENTDDIRESVSLKLIEKLLEYKMNIVVHDPMAIPNTKKLFKNKISYRDKIHDALKDSKCAIIMTPWEEYEKISLSDLKHMEKMFVIDTRRILNKKTSKQIMYIGLGMGHT